MNKYDLIVVGAGPAGLMAAIRAASGGLKVLVLEKNDRAGIKLLITGGGRCNLTNLSFSSIKDLSLNYGPASSFLLSAFYRFGPRDVLNFFEEGGLALKEEKETGRVFPESNKARSVLDFLLQKAKDSSVNFKYSSLVKEVVAEKGDVKKIKEIKLQSGKVYRADNYIIATGGKTYPLTGSSGDAYDWLKSLGHNICPPRAGLRSIKFSSFKFSKLEGLSFSNVMLTIKTKENEGLKKNIPQKKGDIIFTNDAISGPAALNLSLLIPNTKKEKILEIDFFPEESPESLSSNLQEIFHEGKKSLKNSLIKFIPARFVDFILESLSIDLEALANSISKSDRELIVSRLKSFALKVKSEDNFSQAMITIGGLDLKELEPSSFKSKLYNNLYVVGELIDVAAYTGGFNLQLAWTSGYLASSNLLEQ